MVSYDLQRALIFSIYQAVDGTATVIRDYEDVPISSPEIGIRFAGSEYPLHAFLGDYFEPNEIEPYVTFGKYYGSDLVIRIVAKEPQTGGVNLAMQTVEDLETIVRRTVRTRWPEILHEHSGYLLRSPDLRATNVSFTLGTQRFVAKLIRAGVGYLEKWDNVPAEEDRHAPAEHVEILDPHLSTADDTVGLPLSG